MYLQCVIKNRLVNNQGEELKAHSILAIMLKAYVFISKNMEIVEDTPWNAL